MEFEPKSPVRGIYPLGFFEHKLNQLAPTFALIIEWKTFESWTTKHTHIPLSHSLPLPNHLSYHRHLLHCSQSSP